MRFAFRGRFTQEDPIGIAGGLNLYGYANGDPINFSDPFGLCPTCLWGAAIGMGMEAAAQFFTTGEINGPGVAIAGATGAASDGLGTVTRLARGVRALATGLLSVAEGQTKAASTGERTSLAEDAGNLLFGGAASGLADVAGTVADDASRYMFQNSRVRPGSPFSFEARQEMAGTLRNRIEDALIRGALAGGIVGQGGRVVPEEPKQ